MVLYFSGTGNSQLVAVQIAEMIADEAVSINRYIKNGKKADVQSERPLVFVAPTYSWRLPKVVERWILETDFKGDKNAYFILTCGGSCGNAGNYAEKLCAKKGFRFRGLSAVLMPENYIAMFPTPGESESQAIIERAQPCVAELAERIQSEAPFPRSVVSFGGKIESGPINPLFYALFVNDKGFRVSDVCVSCGKCAMRCLLNNISLVDGKPVWKGKCTHCMACIGGCPVKAIEYKSKSASRHHHYIMNDALCWGTRSELMEGDN